MRARSGFTLLEVLLVIILIGFLTAMFLPGGLALDSAARSRKTRQIIDEIAQAIAGPPARFDKSGNPIFAGFTADVGSLPKLYYGTFIWDEDEHSKGWSYFPFGPTDPPRSCLMDLGSCGYADPERFSEANRFTSEVDFMDALCRLHPVGLWDNDSRLAQIPSSAWRGPYLNRPYDQFPRNADSFGFTSGFGGDIDDMGLYERQEPLEYALLQTDDRLADSWGRSLIFWPRWDPDTKLTDLWIISQGPDGSSAWRRIPFALGERYEYINTDTSNTDNIVRVIKHNEWHEHNVGRKIEITQRVLGDLRTAVLGREITADDGLALVGGYIGDFGGYPWLYEWRGDQQMWVLASGRGQPRFLWTRDLDGDGSPDAASLSGWRGPYYRSDVGPLGPTETINDAWGRRIEFWSNEGDFWMISSGADGRSDWSGPGNSYVQSSDPASPSYDDVVSIIRQDWWYPILKDKTASILAQIKSAIARPRGESIAGFFADMGRLPCLYRQTGAIWTERYRPLADGWVRDTWSSSLNKWSTSAPLPLPTNLSGVAPRELWTRDPVGDGSDDNDLPEYKNGLGWRAQYSARPSGADALLRDAWAQPLEYILDSAQLTITSNKAGLSEKLDCSKWYSQGEIDFTYTPRTVPVGTLMVSVFFANDDMLAPNDPKTKMLFTPVALKEDQPGLWKEFLQFQQQDLIPAGPRVVVLWDEQSSPEDDHPDPNEIIGTRVLDLSVMLNAFQLDFR